MFCVIFPKIYSLRALVRPIGVCTVALWLGGCAISTQLGPIFGSAEDPGSTGSITPRDKRFSSNMSDADWEQARKALDTALRPENAATPTAWENAATGLKGTVSPVAQAYQADAQTCHAFVASLVEGIDTHWYQGRACRGDEAGWNVVDSAGWVPPITSNPGPSS